MLNDVQNKLIILQLRVLGLIENLSRGLGQRSFTVIANVRQYLEMVPMIKICTMTLWDLIQKLTFFLTTASNVFGEKLSQEDETLLYLQAQLSSDEES